MTRLSPRISVSVLGLVCLVLVACDGRLAPVGSPSSLDGPTGATIVGLVGGEQPQISGLTSASAASYDAMASMPGLTVTIAGTEISVPVDMSGRFRVPDVPPGQIQLLFTSPTVSFSVVVSNVNEYEQINIQISVSGASATIVNETRSSGKVALCHRTDRLQYHLIEVSVNAESAHRGHGDGAIGERVPEDRTKVFDPSCRPVPFGVTIRKSTNGQDANEAPGPSIRVGSPVTWEYLVRNTGALELTNIRVTDDKNVVVNCQGRTTLPAGQSMTCTGTGTAVAGQYRNVGTVNARQVGGSDVSASDPSHYFGQTTTAQEPEEPKVQLCHRTGNGRYHLIEVGASAEPAHRAHGDGKIGEAVPGGSGRSFGPGCEVR